ncbi:hypothetical protein ACVNP0_04280 [Staphylococcus aureus]
MERHTIYGEIVKGPEYPTMENKTLQGEMVEGPDFQQWNKTDHL